MSDSEEDYMKMTFPPSPPSHTTKSTSTSNPPETSLQRRARLRREAEARSRPKSKSELLAEADRRREAAHATSLLNDPSTSAPSKSKGLAMMAKMGFTGGALGASSATTPTAATEPIRIDIKDGREGIGLESERKRKLREAAEVAGEQVKRARVGEDEYRERVRREREAARWERQVGAAQKVTEGMNEEEAKAGRTLKGVPVVYRGLVRKRVEAERERRMRYDLEQALMRSSKLPGYDDGEEDEDDRRALGKGKTTYVVAEDLDEEDEELEAFEALEPEERLRRVVEYLRREHRYCFWCKCAYPDEDMDGCPGLTEEDHD
ncbi:hypothetical protein B0T18DRAFT_426200 [Schizothecium vesticola]|uniref:G-patch domain-containing protein n=1 Tax=Schizothecium vesticola TaxID=314040 RepID=A0AA40F5D5_9PEZI|nr:hypothetical protein B0T18DRAFT_426200 [Schizothecium vesticola]